MNMLMQSHLSSVALTSYNGLVFFGQHLSRLIISFLSLFLSLFAYVAVNYHFFEIIIPSLYAFKKFQLQLANRGRQFKSHPCGAPYVQLPGLPWI